MILWVFMFALNKYVAIYVYLIYLGKMSGEGMLVQKCLQFMRVRPAVPLPSLLSYHASSCLKTPERPAIKQRSL